jgi:hypothetical protein
MDLLAADHELIPSVKHGETDYAGSSLLQGTSELETIMLQKDKVLPKRAPIACGNKNFQNLISF